MTTGDGAPPLTVFQRLGLAGACALLILAAWGVVAVKHFGLVWPYPTILPGIVHYQRNTYTRQTGCHTRRWYDRNGGVSGARRAKRRGTLTSALWAGGLPEYAARPRGLNGYLLVLSGSCFVMYETDAG